MSRMGWPERLLAAVAVMGAAYLFGGLINPLAGLICAVTTMLVIGAILGGIYLGEKRR